jgi:hypothetical protein
MLQPKLQSMASVSALRRGRLITAGLKYMQHTTGLLSAAPRATAAPNLSSLVRRLIWNHVTSANSTTSIQVITKSVSQWRRLCRALRHSSLKKKVKVLFCPSLPDFSKGAALWQVPRPSARLFGNSIGCLIQTGENRSASSKTCPNATLSSTNFTWTDLGLNPDLRCARPTDA